MQQRNGVHKNTYGMYLENQIGMQNGNLTKEMVLVQNPPLAFEHSLIYVSPVYFGQALKPNHVF